MFRVCDDGYGMGIADVGNSRRQWSLVNMTGDEDDVHTVS